METINGRIVTASGNVLTTDDVIIGNSATAINMYADRATGSSRRLIFRNYGAGTMRVIVPDLIEGSSYVDIVQGDSIEIGDYTDGLWGIVRKTTSDEVVGLTSQLVASPKTILSTSTIYENLQRIDTYKSVQTVKKTIGGIGITADFNFVTAANQNEQVIDLGAIIPARARIIDIYLITDATFTGATSLVADVGNASGGAQFIASATIYAANAVLAQAVGGAFTVAPAVAASNVFVNATPGANWSGVTAGKVSVYVTFINVTNI